MSDQTLGGTRSLGKYELRAVIGRGAMGTVYEAWDPVIDRRVAIKTVNLPAAHDDTMDEEIRRFKREAQAAGRLTHPNIVGVYDYGETSDVAYIVMEFVDGLSVKGVIGSGERFSPATIKRLMSDLLAGLDYSHAAGVIHRDIKPANIMLTKDGRAKIADFGIARIESSSLTQAGTVLGTPAYMSPEQLRGETIDLRTDIYSSAVMLYELLTGERPFDGSLSSIMHKALTTVPPAPSDLSTTSPRGLDAVVARGMAKRAEDRYASAATFMEAIHAGFAQNAADAAGAVPADGTIIGRPAAAPEMALPTPLPPAQPRRSRLPLLLGGGAGVIAASVGAVFLLSDRHPAVDRSLRVHPAETAALIAPPASPPSGQTGAPSAAPDIGPSALPAQAAPAPPFAPPAPVSPPPPDPAILMQRIATSLRSLNCSALTGHLSADGTAVLEGFTAPGGLSRTRALVTAAGATSIDDSAVYEADPSYCDALSAIGPITPGFGVTGSHIVLRDASHSEQLLAGDYIRPRVQMPDYPATLMVDYYAHDGTVEHIYPRAGDPPIKPPADPGRRFGAGELVSLGDPGPHRAVFQVSEPFGRDMIIAIASSDSLFRALRPQNGEQSRNYALNLRGAIEQALNSGAKLSAYVIRMDTIAH